MKFFKFIKKQWEKENDSDKFFYKSGFVVILLSMIIGIFFPWIFDNALKWISEMFSVPIIQERIFQLDAQGILCISLMLLIILAVVIRDLVILIIKKRKKKGKEVKRK